MDEVSVWMAFGGGVVSLLSPCTLPMIPVYLASLSGPEILQSGVAGRRWTVFFHALCFVLGFSAVFVLLGAGAGLIGSAVSAHQVLIRQISGTLLIIFGLYMLASTRISWLNYEKRLSPSTGRAGGYVRSVLIGVIFALAWTPCAGPVLGGILTLAFNTESAAQGSFLLGIYSLGTALPLLIIGLALDWLRPLLKKAARYAEYLYILSGLLLIAAGILLWLNKMNWFV
jgi:cytochrome c-type biogenesis protein